MSQNTVVASSGRATGSPAARRLRAEGKIPGVLYGHGMDPVSVTVDRRELRLALSGAGGFNTLLTLDVDGTMYPAIIKELQRHPIKRTVSHIDFIQVSVNEAIVIAVPLRLEGEAKAVINDGGMVDPAVDHLEIACTPSSMPAEIVVDISAMQPGDVLRLSDIQLPKGATAVGDPDMAVVTAIQTSAGEAAEAAPAPAPTPAAE